MKLNTAMLPVFPICRPSLALGRHKFADLMPTFNKFRSANYCRPPFSLIQRAAISGFFSLNSINALSSVFSITLTGTLCLTPDLSFTKTVRFLLRQYPGYNITVIKLDDSLNMIVRYPLPNLLCFVNLNDFIY